MGLSDCRVEAAIAVSDLDTARGFYEDQLGLAPGEEEEGQGVSYPCAEGTRIFVYLAPENAGKSPARSPVGSSTTSTRRWTGSQRGA